MVSANFRLLPVYGGRLQKDAKTMTKDQWIIAVSCAAEAATGLVLLAAPSLLASLLLGVDAVGVATVIGRIGGITLISLAVACWPRTRAGSNAPYFGMLIYSVAVAFILTQAGLAGGTSGVLLWPAVLYHLIMSVLLALALSHRRSVRTSEG